MEKKGIEVEKRGAVWQNLLDMSYREEEDKLEERRVEGKKTRYDE